MFLIIFHSFRQRKVRINRVIKDLKRKKLAKSVQNTLILTYCKRVMCTVASKNLHNKIFL